MALSCVNENFQDRPLIAFVHVPKTSGTSVNFILSTSTLKGRDHIQNCVADPTELKDQLATLDWVSGHLNPDLMKRFLTGLTDRQLRLFATIRHPVSQIASHYNWLIQIFHISDAFYRAVPENIKEISEGIRGSDNTDPLQVIERISSAGWLMLNQQTKALLAFGGDKLVDNAILDRLKPYEFVATERYLPELIERMTGQTVEVPPVKNKSPYHFDPAVFRTPEVTEFLKEKHNADFALYDYFERIGGCYPPVVVDAG